MLCPVAPRFALLFLLAFTPALRAQTDTPYRSPSPALAALVDAPSAPAVSISPDRKHLLLFARTEAPSIAELAQPELRLAGIRLDPANNSTSRAFTYTGLTLQPMSGAAERRVTGLPAGVRIAHYAWSPDSRHIALSLLRDSSLDLWLVDTVSAFARPLAPNLRLNAVLETPFVWLDDTSLAILQVPADRGPAPLASRVPSGPVSQENLGKKVPARTYDGLLTNAHDETLFDYYGTAELVLLSVAGKLTPLNVRGLITRLAPSPDGQHLMIETLHRPYSYQVPASRFPKYTDVINRAGGRDYRVSDSGLDEASDANAGGVRAGPRQVAWRADQPATLSWAQSLDRRPTAATPSTAEKKSATVRERDAWFTFAAPFKGSPVEQQRFEYRVASIAWGDDSLALVTESWPTTRTVRTWRVAPGQPGGQRELLSERSSQDRYADPGTPMMRPGRGAVMQVGDYVYLAGAGASPRVSPRQPAPRRRATKNASDNVEVVGRRSSGIDVPIVVGATGPGACGWGGSARPP